MAIINSEKGYVYCSINKLHSDKPSLSLQEGLTQRYKCPLGFIFLQIITRPRKQCSVDLKVGTRDARIDRKAVKELGKGERPQDSSC